MVLIFLMTNGPSLFASYPEADPNLRTEAISTTVNNKYESLSSYSLQSSCHFHNRKRRGKRQRETRNSRNTCSAEENLISSLFFELLRWAAFASWEIPVLTFTDSRNQRFPPRLRLSSPFSQVTLFLYNPWVSKHTPNARVVHEDTRPPGRPSWARGMVNRFSGSSSEPRRQLDPSLLHPHWSPRVSSSHVPSKLLWSVWFLNHRLAPT